MKKETFIIICGGLFLVLLVIAIFNHPAMQTASAEMLHEIKTADVWHGAAYTPVVNNFQGVAIAAPSAYPYANGVQGNYPQYQVQTYSPQDPNQAIALTNTLPIVDPDKPVLIKQMGVEVEPISGGKVKITGVMGNSWAEKAGLKVGDILLSFDAKEITDLKQFQDMMIKAAPEMSYKVVYYRNARKLKCLVTIGEGEMDGFTPIPPPVNNI